MSDDVFASDELNDSLEEASSSMQDDHQGGHHENHHGGDGGGRYADELLSKKIKGRSRTFFLDLKQSSNGKFVKISELSRGGRRSTIMFDGEDLEEFIAALQELKSAL